jgi:hypothetical protein
VREKQVERLEGRIGDGKRVLIATSKAAGAQPATIPETAGPPKGGFPGNDFTPGNVNHGLEWLGINKATLATMYGRHSRTQSAERKESHNYLLRWLGTPNGFCPFDSPISIP